MWTPRVRAVDLTLGDPLLFSSLTLVERYGPADTLLIEGDVDDLRPAFDPPTGILLVDDTGRQRLSGVPPTHPKLKVDRRGDRTATLTYEADTIRLWEHFCWPTPAAAFTAQTTAHDVQTDSVEDRILGFINRNVGGAAYHSGTNDRRIPFLRIPASEDRGATGKTSARFDRLGQLVADLAATANLRVTIQQVWDAGSPFIDVVVDDVPDLSAWARFGDADAGDLGLLDEAWRYGIGAGVSVVLSAADGELENRHLTLSQDAARETAWGRRIEFLLSQGGTTDTGEAAAAVAAAMTDNAPTVEVSAPVAAGDLTFGPGAGNIPVGALVAVTLDGELVVDRITEITTTVTADGTDETVSVKATFGSPEAGLTIDQRRLRNAQLRLSRLERDQ